MKVMLAGDTHGDQTHLRALMARAKREGADLVFVLGDFGYWEHTHEGVVFLDKLNRHSVREGIPIYFLDGNHDKTSLIIEEYGDQRDDEGFLKVRSNIFYAPRGHRWNWGRSFIALGGAYSTDKDWRLGLERKRDKKPGSYWFPEEEMSDVDLDKILLADSSPVDIILSHDKPRASNPKWNRKDFFECYFNQDRIQKACSALKPKRLFHGHLHTRYTDSILVGWVDPEEVVVDGLDCNHEADHGTSKWVFEDTYVILDLVEDL